MNKKADDLAFATFIPSQSYRRTPSELRNQLLTRTSLRVSRLAFMACSLGVIFFANRFMMSECWCDQVFGSCLLEKKSSRCNRSSGWKRVCSLSVLFVWNLDSNQKGTRSLLLMLSMDVISQGKGWNQRITICRQEVIFVLSKLVKNPAYRWKPHDLKCDWLK